MIISRCPVWFGLFSNCFGDLCRQANKPVCARLKLLVLLYSDNHALLRAKQTLLCSMLTPSRHTYQMASLPHDKTGSQSFLFKQNQCIHDYYKAYETTGCRRFLIYVIFFFLARREFQSVIMATRDLLVCHRNFLLLCNLLIEFGISFIVDFFCHIMSKW